MSPPPGVRVALLLMGCRSWTRASEPDKASRRGQPCDICKGTVRTPDTYCLGCSRVHKNMARRLGPKPRRPCNTSGPTKYAPDPDGLKGGTESTPGGSGPQLSNEERKQLLHLIRHNPLMRQDPKVQAWLRDQGLA